MSEKCKQVIDTPEYNRLRDLKQLGLTYFVFPSATHTRQKKKKKKILLEILK